VQLTLVSELYPVFHTEFLLVLMLAR